MNISYSVPLTLGWNRMKNALFQPFDLTKWLRIGFTAFLASLTDCQGTSGWNYSNSHHARWDDFFRFPDTAWNWLQDHPLWFNLIILGILLAIALGIFFTWISSRGKFMFLYNVANEKSEISIPWSEYRRQGNSLFVWRLIFGWLAVILFILFLVYCFVASKNLYYGDYPGMVVFWKIAGMILILLAYIFVVGYISLFLNDFVVPVMYRHRLGATAGWLKFLNLFFRYPFTFIIYGVFILVLWIAASVAIVFFALVTCCIGLLFLAIPFIGSVILLPISYTFRALSIEFLAQFGDDFNVFPKMEEVKSNDLTN